MQDKLFVFVIKLIKLKSSSVFFWVNSKGISKFSGFVASPHQNPATLINYKSSIDQEEALVNREKTKVVEINYDSCLRGDEANVKELLRRD